MEHRAVGDEPHAAEGQQLTGDLAVRLLEREHQSVLRLDPVGAAGDLEVEVDRAAGLGGDGLSSASNSASASSAVLPGAQRRVPTSRHSTGWRL